MSSARCLTFYSISTIISQGHPLFAHSNHTTCVDAVLIIKLHGLCGGRADLPGTFIDTEPRDYADKSQDQ